MTHLFAPGVALLPEVIEVLTELRNQREFQGLTRTELCQRAGLPHQSVHRLESNAGHFSHALVRSMSAMAAALGYRLRFVLVADRALNPPTGDERPYGLEKGAGMPSLTDGDAVAELIREVAHLVLVSEEGWSAFGAPGDRLRRGSVFFEGREFTLLRTDDGRVLVYTAREWEAFREGVCNGEFDQEAGLAAPTVEGSKA